MDEVSKSMARISFKWNKKHIVIPGVIASSGVIHGDTQHSLIVVVDGTFYEPAMASGPKVVELPINGGYEEHAHPPSEIIMDGKNYVCVLQLTKVSQKVKDHVRPIKFETGLVRQSEDVNSFVFPTEDYPTPTAYCPGFIIDAHKELLIHSCHVHEFAHFGSALLNQSHNLIGISSGSQGHTQSWSVEFLKEIFGNSLKFKRLTSNISYFKNGIPEEEANKEK